MLPTYAELSKDWFFLLFPRGESFAQFEGADGKEDRLKTKRVLQQMLEELPRTFKEVLKIPLFEYSQEVLGRLDSALTPTIIDHWVENSDPEDANNFFKLTLSELSVYFGNLLLRRHPGSWRYARFPNYFESSVMISSVDFLVFDSVMKRCSHDHQHETLVSKLEAFERAIAGSRVTGSGRVS